MSVLGVIPARYASTRFPGKPLHDIAGKSLIQRVWEQASRAKQLSAVLVATDDERILAHVSGFGGTALMTSTEHQSGTDRLGEVARLQTYQYYVNIQGDEPLLPPEEIDELVGETVARQAHMSTLVTQLSLSQDAAEIQDPNVVKVVRDQDGYALYFSRAPIPFPRKPDLAKYLKHIGIYMYTRETLLKLCRSHPAPLEQAESLEQLRALSQGVRILCVSSTYNPIGVDTPEEALRVALRLGARA